MLALVVLGLVHRWVPQSRWLLVHMATLGVVTNSILVWTQHFADSLLRGNRSESARQRQVVRVATLNAGIALVCVGMVAAAVSFGAALGPWVATAGAVIVGCALTWHALALHAQVRASLPARFSGVVRWYVAAACLLPLGASYGAVMAFSQPEPWQGRLLVAHLMLNVMGFVGLTAAATLLTLWPTMLRTPMAPWSEKVHRFALPQMLVSVLIGVVCGTFGLRQGAAFMLLAWLVGLGAALAPAVATACRRRPRDFPTWSVAAAVGWVVACSLWLSWLLLTRDPLPAEQVKHVTGALVTGGLMQLVVGAMSYLMPVVMGGGPSVVRVSNTIMGRAGALRVSLVNAGLVGFLVAQSSLARVLTSLLVYGAFCAVLPLIVLMVRHVVCARSREVTAATRRPIPPEKSPPSEEVAPTSESSAATTTPPEGAAAREQTSKGRRDLFEGAVGLAAVAGTVAWLERGRSPVPSGASVPPTGRTVRVTVIAKDMRFTPDAVTVNPGDRLVLQVRNDDPSQVHDLVVENGTSTGRLRPGQVAQTDLGVISGPMEGWCTIVGHRAMGMVFHVRTSTAQTAQAATGVGVAAASQRVHVDLSAKPGKGFRTRDARRPATPAGDVRVELVVREIEQEVAPGWTQKAMTYNGRVMGPLIQASLGRTVTVTLRNQGSMGHSVDFHAGDVAPDRVMRTIAPGASLVYQFTARRSGIWLYHCSTMPMSAHLAAGMYGAVIVEPPALPTVDREYVLVQQEAYLGPRGGEVDSAKIADERPDLVMWNGHANQYVHDPLVAKVGERVRIWVLAAGPSRGTSFHVVGSQFDTVFKEGEWLLKPNAHQGGAQALDLAPCQGGFVEMVFREAGTYTFVNHAFVDMERGARGLIVVSA